MKKKKSIAISVGDLNGVGIEIALLCHEQISKKVKPIYCISEAMLKQACKRLGMEKPKNMILFPIKGEFTIKPGVVDEASGRYSHHSFQKAIELCEKGIADALVTLPVHKEAWAKASVPYKGHTDMLRDWFKQEAIMMLGCKKLYVALYTEHMPLKEVPERIQTPLIKQFLLDLSKDVQSEKIAVLGLNPHAGDGGVLGDEETSITDAINAANEALGQELFHGPFVPDTAFTKQMRKSYQHYVAMYHDQGLIPLKALHFEESINISLNLPIVRTSVDHGTAFDIAYHSKNPSVKSYKNAIKAALKQLEGKLISNK